MRHRCRPEGYAPQPCPRCTLPGRGGGCAWCGHDPADPDAVAGLEARPRCPPRVASSGGPAGGVDTPKTTTRADRPGGVTLNALAQQRRHWMPAPPHLRVDDQGAG